MAEEPLGTTRSCTVTLFEKLSLNGNFHLVLQLLRRLDHPEMTDEMALTVFRCTAGGRYEDLWIVRARLLST